MAWSSVKRRTPPADADADADVPSVPARATGPAASIAAANPEMIKYLRIEKVDVCRLDAQKAARGFNVRCFEPIS
jgi:hypothetical protein